MEGTILKSKNTTMGRPSIDSIMKIKLRLTLSVRSSPMNAGLCKSSLSMDAITRHSVPAGRRLLRRSRIDVFHDHALMHIARCVCITRHYHRWHNDDCVFIFFLTPWVYNLSLLFFLLQELLQDAFHPLLDELRADPYFWIL
jgi:hypothetical protein